MQGQHSHGDAYYRCRFPQEYALANRLEHPRNVYLREKALIDPLDRWLLQAFSPAQRDHTIARLAEQAATDLPAAAMPAIDTSIIGYDAKLVRHRAALEAGAVDSAGGRGVTTSLPVRRFERVECREAPLRRWRRIPRTGIRLWGWPGTS
jgi:hypothetical protein